MENNNEWSPKVSIIIPVYNGLNYLQKAIDSALAQSYKNTEVLVINDGSDDNGATEKIAKAYGNKIRYFHKPNGGVSTALNYGIREMTGEYFSWLSHDDEYHCDKLERQISFLRTCECEDTILYGGYELINVKSKSIGVVDFSRQYPIERLNIPLFPVLRGMANGCTMLIHRSHFQRVGLFREDLCTTQDYDLWFRMFRGASVRFCSGISVKTRIHPSQTGRTLSDHTRECDELWIWMLDQLTSDEMTQMEGSPYRFYLATADFLRKHSAYAAAEQHARYLAQIEQSKCRTTGTLEIAQINVPQYMSDGGVVKRLRRLSLSFRLEGVGPTLRRIMRKLR